MDTIRNDPMDTAFDITMGILGSMKNRADKSLIKQNNKRDRRVSKTKASISELASQSVIGGNYLITGGDPTVRGTIIAYACSIALQNGRTPVLIHPSNHRLCELVDSACGGNTVHIGPRMAQYEPYDGYESREICRRMITSAENLETARIGQNAIPYILGMQTLATVCGTKPCFENMRRFPFGRLNRLIDSCVVDGSLSSAEASEILDSMQVGIGESPAIMNYLDSLYQDGRDVMWSGACSERGSIRTLSNRKCAITIDISSYRNETLLSTVLDEPYYNADKSFIFVFDSLRNGSGAIFKQFLRESGNGLSIIVSTEDVLTSMNADESTVKTFMGSSSGCIVMRHASGATCDLVSSMLGFFEKTIVSENRGASRNYGGFAPHYGTSGSYTTSTSTAPRVPPEEIARLGIDEAFVTDSSGSIFLTRLKREVR